MKTIYGDEFIESTGLQELESIEASVFFSLVTHAILCVLNFYSTPFDFSSNPPPLTKEDR